jgi:multidrug resistance protein
MISRVRSRASLNRSRSKSLVSLARKKTEPFQAPALPLSDLDNGIVGWDHQDDPENALNFTTSRKWSIVAALATITFMTPFGSSILAPAIRFIIADFGTDDLTVGSLPVTIYLLGYTVGPLFLSPLSEIYGRHLVLTTANCFFLVWLIACAVAPSLPALIVFRFFAGIGGSGCMTIGGGVISDMIHIHQRGLALTLWIMGPLFGPSIGPLVGAFIAETIGWRWSNWIVLIPAAITTVAIAIFGSETNPHVLMRRKVARLGKELGRTDLKSCYDASGDSKPKNKTSILLRGLVRPLKMLFLSPMLICLSVYIAFAYGVLYLLFNTIPMVFQGQYGWSLGVTGLAYIPLGFGYLVGMGIFSYLSDKRVVELTRANGGVYEPEMRLTDCIWFSPMLPITFFWYGWSTHYATHWIVPLLGLIPFAIGILGVWMPIQAYIIDAFGHFAASALAAFIVYRSVVGAFLPLAGPQMYASLGLGWGNSVLGFISIVLIPVPSLIYHFGAKLRKLQRSNW